MAKPPKQPKPPPPPPRKVINRTSGGPNAGGRGNAHAGKGNPHGKRNR
jgi:hypothetical protein